MPCMTAAPCVARARVSVRAKAVRGAGLRKTVRPAAVRVNASAESTTEQLEMGQVCVRARRGARPANTSRRVFGRETGDFLLLASGINSSSVEIGLSRRVGGRAGLDARGPEGFSSFFHAREENPLTRQSPSRYNVFPVMGLGIRTWVGVFRERAARERLRARSI